MGFNNSNGSFSNSKSNGSRQWAKRGLPRIQPVPRRYNRTSRLKDGLRGHGTSLDCTHSKKAAAIFPESQIEDIDIENQLIFAEGLSDESDCTWLSSDCKFRSLLGSDDSRNVREFDCWDFSLQDQFSSILSLSGKNGCSSMFDGSRISPIVEASLVLERPSDGIYRKHVQEKVAVWLHKADGNEVTDSSAGCSESDDSSYGRSLCEDSSMFEISSTSFSTHDHTPSHARDFDRTDIWVSLLDLDGEDSDWVQDGDQVFDVFGSDFPSPCSAMRNLVVTSSNSGSKTSSCQTRGAESPSDDFAADEPLFWPFDRNSYRSPEFDKNFLCISPRKGLQGLDGSKSGRLRLHQMSNPPVGSDNVRGCRRRILFSSRPKLATAEWRARGLNNNVVQKIKTTSSRLSRSTEALYEQHPCNSTIIPRSLQRQKHRGGREMFSKHLLGLEGGEIRDLVVEGDLIERMVGLGEFDGHEGIDVGLDEDQFSPDGSPYKKETSLRDRSSGLADRSDRKVCSPC